MTRGLAIWLLPFVLALHNLEEGIFFPRYLPRVLERLPPDVRDWIGPVSLREMGVALVLATLIPLGFSVWAAARPASRTRCGWSWRCGRRCCSTQSGMWRPRRRSLEDMLLGWPPPSA